MAAVARTSGRERNTSVELAQRALDASANYATVIGGAAFALILLARLPFVGGLFALLQLLLGVVAYPVVGFLVTASLQRFYHGPTRTLLAGHFGLGAAVAITVALAMARLAGGLVQLMADGPASGHGVMAVVRALGALLGHTLGDAASQLAVGGLLAILGGFVAFDRGQLREEVARIAPKI
jgi:hypothetical protein